MQITDIRITRTQNGTNLVQIAFEDTSGIEIILHQQKQIKEVSVVRGKKGNYAKTFAIEFFEVFDIGSTEAAKRVLVLIDRFINFKEV